MLQRIGRVLRMGDSRMTKVIIRGWYEELEKLPKSAERKKKTLHYWRKLLRENGIDWKDAGELAQDRQEWRSNVNKRMKHLRKFEEGQGHKTVQTVTERDVAVTKKNN